MPAIIAASECCDRKVRGHGPFLQCAAVVIKRSGQNSFSNAKAH
jgi:hypothetical protein